MTKGLQTITVHASLSPYGDALIYGDKQAYGYEPGLYLKHLLFAGHADSFYGTELAVQQTGEADVIVLPAEQVLSFWASPELLRHVNWEFADGAALLTRLAPHLAACIERRAYHPSFAAYRKGGLGWVWDAGVLKDLLAGDKEARRMLRHLQEAANKTALYGSADEDGAAIMEDAEEAAAWMSGLEAAFSAAVTRRYYSTEADMADLRSEFPALFERRAALIAGMNEAAWLIAVGWKADASPFRPVLSLLEPEEADASWQLSFSLQDKLDAAVLYPVHLASDGSASGEWPDGWESHVRERSRSWLMRLSAALPPEFLGGADLSALRAANAPQAADTDAAAEQLSGSGSSAGDGADRSAMDNGAGSVGVSAPADSAGQEAAGHLAPAGAGPTTSGDRVEDVLAQPLSNDAAWRFLKEYSETLLQAGWQVLLPAWWEAASRRKPRLKARIKGSGEEESAQSRGPSFFGFDALIDFDWRIAIGEADLSESEFNELVDRNERLVKFRGQWMTLDPVFLTQIRRAMDSIDPAQGLSFQDVLQLKLLEAKQEQRAAFAQNAGAPEAPEAAEEDEPDAARVRIEVEVSGHFARLISQLSRQEQWPALPVPEGLQVTLRPYQHEGFAWLAFLRKFGLGAILADDMGLGKTVQLIAYLLHTRNSLSEAGHPAAAPALIICPTSVLGNWQKELGRFAPSLSVMLHYGGGRESGTEFIERTRQADVVLTSYATAALDQEVLQTVHWEAICLDEAQNIKNAQTKQSQAVRSFSARHRIALTGTPIENRLSELWSLYDFIAPGYLGSARAFQTRFAGPIERDHDEQRTADLKKLTTPFLLRRKKKDPAIQLDLPEKNEMKTYVNLTAEQGALYDQAVSQLISQMGALKGIQRKGAILSALTHLKQLCDHPLLVSGNPVPGQQEEVLEEADFESLTQQSAKLERLLAMVRELREEDERCLIFTQYIGMGEMLRSVLEHELKESVLYLNGSTSKTARDRMIEQFQSGEGGGVFILSLKAGGVGLNLTAANHVFHFDRWWNPAVENQATDRAYRMGQTRDVQVHKFITLGTLEERIDEMLESKQQLSDNIISSSEGWITELSNDELRELFTLRRDYAG